MPRPCGAGRGWWSDCVFRKFVEVVNCRIQSLSGVGEKLLIAVSWIVVSALAVVPTDFFIGLRNLPVDADYSVNVSRAGGVHVEVVGDAELLLVANHVVEDFEEVESEVCGGHFDLSFLVWLIIT